MLVQIQSRLLNGNNGKMESPTKFSRQGNDPTKRNDAYNVSFSSSWYILIKQHNDCLAKMLCEMFTLYVDKRHQYKYSSVYLVTKCIVKQRFPFFAPNSPTCLYFFRVVAGLLSTIIHRTKVCFVVENRNVFTVVKTCYARYMPVYVDVISSSQWSPGLITNKDLLSNFHKSVGLFVVIGNRIERRILQEISTMCVPILLVGCGYTLTYSFPYTLAINVNSFVSVIYFVNIMEEIFRQHIGEV